VPVTVPLTRRTLFVELAPAELLLTAGIDMLVVVEPVVGDGDIDNNGTVEEEEEEESGTPLQNPPWQLLYAH